MIHRIDTQYLADHRNQWPPYAEIPYDPPSSRRLSMAAYTNHNLPNHNFDSSKPTFQMHTLNIAYTLRKDGSVNIHYLIGSSHTDFSGSNACRCYFSLFSSNGNFARRNSWPESNAPSVLFILISLFHTLHRFNCQSQWNQQSLFSIKYTLAGEIKC